MLQRLNTIAIFTTVCLSTVPLSAHPISLTDAVINVTPKKVDVEIRILVEDLVLYQNMALKEVDRYAYRDLIEAAKKHQRFVLDGLTIRDASGLRLKGKLFRMNTERLSEQGVLQSETKEASVSYHLTYPTSQTSFLKILQGFGGDKAILPTLMDCMILQNDVLLEKPLQLVGKQSHTVRLDWANPPTKAKNWRELRARHEAEFRKRLGIASYSGLYSFLYITNREVRHEVLVPVLTLESWMPIKRADPSILTVAEQDAARKSLERLVRQKARIKIDGFTVRPKLSRVNFFALDINDFAQNVKPRDVSVHNARVGIILTYSTRGLPKSISLKWQLFSKFAPFMKTIVLAFQKDPVEHFLRATEPRFNWKRDPKMEPPKTITVTKRGSGKVTGKSATTVVSGLLRNVYRAFDYSDEGDVYDALALSVDGKLLRTIYLLVKRSLVMTEQGGAKATIQDLKITKSRLVKSEKDTWVLDATWQVSGNVEHWGHVHTRRNEYHALFTVRGKNEWKIVGLELKNQKRLEFKTGLRQAKP